MLVGGVSSMVVNKEEYSLQQCEGSAWSHLKNMFHIKEDKDFSCLFSCSLFNVNIDFPEKCSLTLALTLRCSTSIHTEHWIVLCCLWVGRACTFSPLYNFFFEQCTKEILWVIPSVINEQHLSHVSLFHTHTFLWTSTMQTHVLTLTVNVQNVGYAITSLFCKWQVQPQRLKEKSNILGKNTLDFHLSRNTNQFLFYAYITDIHRSRRHLA